MLYSRSSPEGKRSAKRSNCRLMIQDEKRVNKVETRLLPCDYNQNKVERVKQTRELSRQTNEQCLQTVCYGLSIILGN